VISKELEVSLNLAVSEAARRGHEYVTVEHVLYALLFNEIAAKALRACGGNVDETRTMLEDYFKEHYPAETLKPGQMPQPTVAFQRVIQRAAQHVRAAGKDQISGDTLLVSIFSERESFALYFLQKQNITRFDVLNFISHGITKYGDDAGEDAKSLPPADSEAEAQGEDKTMDDDADDGNGGGGRGERMRDKDPLKLYAQNLCARARAGKIDPLIGRDARSSARRRCCAAGGRTIRSTSATPG